MATLRFVVLCIALFAGVANAHGYYRPTGLPEGAQLGDSCTPRGQPRRCGEATLLGRTETELNETDGIEGLVNKFCCKWYMYPFFNSADRTCVECPRCTCSKYEATRIKSFATEADLEVVVVCRFYDTTYYAKFINPIQY